MIVIYANESFPTTVTKAIMLCGPTPRGDGPSWRKEALSILEKLGYDGHVFIPEPADGQWAEDYMAQVNWEEKGLNRADAIVFWVPRDITGGEYGCPMPGFTTNDEWGYWRESGKVVWGSPGWAEKVRYQEHHAKKLGVPQGTTLEETLRKAISRLGKGSIRRGGECAVPLHIWEKKEFRAWLTAQQRAGNRLDEAKVLWTFWVGPKRDFLFSWALHVDVYIGSEKRSKINEFVLGRTDIAAVVPHSSHPTLYDADDRRDVTQLKVVLVKEFRSPVRNEEGFVYELPGGSSKEDESTAKLAIHELEEETGLKIGPDRLKPVGRRQIAATLSAHIGTLFSVELTDDELKELEADTQVHGVEEDSERTYVKVFSIQELLESCIVDWATMGMILAALRKV
jgi:8-oxo-dGTP pyrophosphatase MutT (NUDIX family)